MSKGSENRIFVNHVPAGATTEDLVSHFSQFGTTSDVYLPPVFGTSQHKGIGYITFDFAESKDLALQCPAHIIMGQQVLVQVCMPKGSGKGPMPGTTASGDRIFISQLPQDATQDEVQAYFAQFGAWSDIFLPKGNFPAGHKGICFITYTNPASVAQVLQTGPHSIRGQQIVVDVAAPRTQKGSPGGGKGPPEVIVPSSAPVPSVAPSFAATAVVVPPPAWPGVVLAQPHQAALQQPAGPVLPGRLFLTKVSPTINQDDLTAYFQQFGALNDVYIPSGGKAIAFVGYNDPTIASAVAHMATHEVKQGCFVNVDVAIDRPALPGKGQGGKQRFAPY